MRVIAGILKGSSIPFVNEKYNNANVTPQKVKEALFSMLGENLEGKYFLDLYACSGQIGLEALSRGAGFVVFNEIDARRNKFIASQVRRLKLEETSRVFKYHAFRCLRYLFSKDYRFDLMFIDPPYIKKKGEAAHYNEILEELGKYPLLKENGRIIIQHFVYNKFSEDAGTFVLADRRDYANNSLSFYEYK